MLEGELAFSKLNLTLTCCTSVHIMHDQDFLMLKEKLYVKHEVFHPHTEDESAWNSQDGTTRLLAFHP